MQDISKYIERLDKVLKESQEKMRESIEGVISDPVNPDHYKQFQTGALRDRPIGKGIYAAISPVAMDRLAQRIEYGHIKYGDCRNWEKGMPVSEFITSSLRHIFQYLDGDDSEDHLAAAFWNLHCAMHMEVKVPEMMDIPSRKLVEKHD